MYLSSFLETLRRQVDGSNSFLISRRNHLVVYKLSSKWPPYNRWREQKLLESCAFKHFLGTTTLPVECQSGQPCGRDILIFHQEMTCQKHIWFLAWNLERVAQIRFLEDRAIQLQSGLEGHLHFLPVQQCGLLTVVQFDGRHSVGEVLTA